MVQLDETQDKLGNKINKLKWNSPHRSYLFEKVLTDVSYCLEGICVWPLFYCALHGELLHYCCCGAPQKASEESSESQESMKPIKHWWDDSDCILFISRNLCALNIGNSRHPNIINSFNEYKSWWCTLFWSQIVIEVLQWNCKAYIFLYIKQRF